jgi:hypothetical protein
MYESKLDFFEPNREAVAQWPVEVNISAGGLLLLAVLGMLNLLVKSGGVGYTRAGNRNASKHLGWPNLDALRRHHNTRAEAR